MNARLAAIQCIEAVFTKCKGIEEAYEDLCEDTLTMYVEAYAAAWEQLHSLLRQADMLERSLAYLMEQNRTLSGENLMAFGAVRADADVESDDVALLHDKYVESLAAISRILEGAESGAQP